MEYRRSHLAKAIGATDNQTKVFLHAIQPSKKLNKEGTWLKLDEIEISFLHILYLIWKDDTLHQSATMFADNMAADVEELYRGDQEHQGEYFLAFPVEYDAMNRIVKVLPCITKTNYSDIRDCIKTQSAIVVSASEVIFLTFKVLEEDTEYKEPPALQIVQRRSFKRSKVRLAPAEKRLLSFVRKNTGEFIISVRNHGREIDIKKAEPIRF